MGAPSNVFTLGIARQSGKGVIPADPQFLTRVTGASVMANRQNARIEETGTGRDGGDRYTTRINIEGGADFVLRPKIGPMILHGILGSLASAGVAAPYTHTVTPADDQPYFTIWRYLAGVLIEKFEDCKFTSLTINGSAGNLLGVSTSLVGLRPTRLTALPAGWDEATKLDASTPLRVPGVDYQIKAVRNRAVRDFSLTISAAQNPLQTDEIFDSFVEPGQRTVELNYTEVFQNLDLYNSILYGSTTGTAVEEDVHRGVWQATFGDFVAGPAFRIVIPNYAFLTAPLAPDPGGDPLQLAVTGAADPPTSGSIITTTFVNDQAATVYAAAA